MSRWEVLRHALSRISGALMLMIAGAWLLNAYLFLRHPQSRAALEGVDDVLFWAFLLCASLRPRLSAPDSRPREPSPRWSGTAVVLVTGLAAAFFVSRDAGGSAILTGVIGFGTVGLAVMVWRFATRHAAEIGEARFTGDGPTV